MNTTNCYRCGNVFTGYGSLCSICKQNELLKEEAEKNRALQESIHNQNMALQRQAAQQAEYARQEAIFARQEAADLARENARLIAESNISSDDAYNYGFKYITLNWSRGNNPHNLSITAGEDGLLRADWISPYQLPHLYQSFSSGISEALGQYERPGREFIEKMAYVAGQEIAKGVLPSESFALGANGVEVEGIEINTRGFAINRETQINEVTGEISYKYVPPFVDEKLNSLFADGMNHGAAELNTPELIHQRLQAIEELKNKRLQEQEEEKKLKEKEEELKEKQDKLIEKYLKVFTALVLFIALFYVYSLTNYKSDKSPQIQSKARELNPLEAHRPQNPSPKIADSPVRPSPQPRGEDVTKAWESTLKKFTIEAPFVAENGSVVPINIKFEPPLIKGDKFILSINNDYVSEVHVDEGSLWLFQYRVLMKDAQNKIFVNCSPRNCRGEAFNTSVTLTAPLQVTSSKASGTRHSISDGNAKFLVAAEATNQGIFEVVSNTFKARVALTNYTVKNPFFGFGASIGALGSGQVCSTYRSQGEQTTCTNR
jgi:hypothetical protein